MLCSTREAPAEEILPNFRGKKQMVDDGETVTTSYFVYSNRHGQELSYRLRARKKRIVPIAMKLTGFDIERLKLIVGDL